MVLFGLDLILDVGHVRNSDFGFGVVRIFILNDIFQCEWNKILYSATKHTHNFTFGYWEIYDHYEISSFELYTFKGPNLLSQ